MDGRPFLETFAPRFPSLVQTRERMQNRGVSTMENYEHFGETRRGETDEASEKVGPCLTCRYWQTDEQRTPNLSGSIMQCVQSELKPFHLMVSGSSGCN